MSRNVLLAIALAALLVAVFLPATFGQTSQQATPGPSSSVDLSRLRVSTAGWRTDFSRASVDLAEIISGGPPKDGIPAIDAPSYEAIDAARGWLPGTSPVIAMTLGESARAYPLAILIWHEIVNDTLDGVPIVVTFCPLCNTALVFERTVEGVVHDYGTTGNLRFSDLVMYDRQTESWWQQATGEAIVGELTGTSLRFLAAQIVSLDDFAAGYPDGDVLRRPGELRSYGQNPYPGYDQAGERPFLVEGAIDGRIAPKERVVTVGTGSDAIAFTYTDLAVVGVATDMVDREPVVVFWVPGVSSALDASDIASSRDIGATGVFRPVVDGRSLTFERTGGPDAPIVDLQTGSTWSITGRATRGELAGSQLEPLPHGDHFWFAWAAFAPDTRVWAPD